MSVFSRMRSGWKIGWLSLSVLRDNPKLLLFVLASGATLLVVISSFIISTAMMIGLGHKLGLSLDPEYFEQFSSPLLLIAFFFFYLVTYTIIIFFNVALTYCSNEVLKGGEVHVKEGLRFALSRIEVVLSWAAMAATVGAIFRFLEEKLGFVGAIIAGIVGVVWSIATYFVVPVLAFEDVTPGKALKRSAEVIREKWGESLGVNFSFGLFYLLGYLLVLGLGVPTAIAQPVIGVGFIIVGILTLHVVMGAAKTLFLTAAYQHTQGLTDTVFDDEHLFDEMFAPKRKRY